MSSELTTVEAIRRAHEWQESSEMLIAPEIVTALIEGCQASIAVLERTMLVPMLLWCPECGARHIDVGEFATKKHHTHACQSCGHCWRPAIVATVGVQFLPGFKNETA